MHQQQSIQATTILCVRRGRQVALGGDGQVTLGNTVLKNKARKVRTLHEGTILAGFAGGAADAFTLFERFERKIEEFHGDLSRAAVELAREWRSDRALRRLEAMLLVADRKQTLLVSGTGDVIEPDDGVAAIGSGGGFAEAAARALFEHSAAAPGEIVQRALAIAARLCIYTNTQITVEELR